MAFNRIKWVKGDTKPIPQFTVELAGSAVDLTSCTVKFKIYAKGSTTQLNTGHDTCTIIVAGDGTCKYTPVAADTATVGLYEGSLMVTFADATVQTIFDKIPIEIIESTGAIHLCTVQDVESQVQMSFTSSSKPTAEQVLNWIVQASSGVEEYTGRKYSETTVTNEYHDGNGTHYIMLNYYPVTSITSLTVDSTALTENTDYWLRDSKAGIIECLEAPEPRTDGISTGHRNIVCTYKYGVTSIPAMVREFCAVTVALRVVAAAGLAKTDGGAIKSYSDGDVSISYSDTDRATAALIARYNELKMVVPRKFSMSTGGLEG